MAGADPVASSSAAAPSSTTRATPQGGIIEGVNPSKYNPADPIVLFIIQAAIIIIFCRLLHYPLSRLRQPRVIAEVIGGILLGPSVMGRIPGFSDAIFPRESKPILNLVANLGLVLFLFLVGLEADLRLVASNWRIALGVGAAGMMLPFGLGAAIAWGLYNQFRTEPDTVPVSFGVYMLFIGVAMAITAFPVLCRILTELKLLNSPVGIIVLSAGVGNDVAGWILLALCVALVNAGSGLTALWVLLTCTGWVLFLMYAVRPLFRWHLIRTGSLENGPSQSVMALTLLMVLTSAWFTNVIGVHAIFGGFLVGLICPHDGGFAIKLTEKIEDLVTVFFLPLYFALSGLNTNVGLLDNGITWGYVIGVLAVAFVGKIVGGTLAARASKLVWRESLTIGVLMSCKGLVELIVLNIGLQAKILSTRTFTIFVVMALVTTFATTPLTQALYPPWYQKKLDAWKRGEIDWDGKPLVDDESGSGHGGVTVEKLQNAQIRRLLVHLRLDSLPSLFTFISLLGGPQASTVQKVHPDKVGSASHGAEEVGDGGGSSSKENGDASAGQNSTETTTPPPPPRSTRPLEVHGIRLMELSERTSSVMQVSEMEEVRDPIVNVFHTFGHLNRLAVSGGVSVVPEDSYAETLVSKASDLGSDLLLVPWSESGSIFDANDPRSGGGVNVEARLANGPYQQFVTETLARSSCSTAILVNRGFGGRSMAEPRPFLSRSISGLSLRSNREVVPIAPITDPSHHIFMPFFGGEDDRVGMRFVLQLAQNSNITATIVYIDVGIASSTSTVIPMAAGNVQAADAEAEDDQSQRADQAFFNSLRDSLPPHLESRVLFDTINASFSSAGSGGGGPLHETLERARREVGRQPKNAGDLVVVGRRRRFSLITTTTTMTTTTITTGAGAAAGMGMGMGMGMGAPGANTTTKDLPSVSPDTRLALGDLADAIIAGNVRASVLVIQAAGGGKKMM